MCFTSKHCVWHLLLVKTGDFPTLFEVPNSPENSMILDNFFYLYPKMTHHQLWSIRFFKNHHGDTFYHTRWKDKKDSWVIFSAISVSKASPGCCVCQQWSHSIWCSCHGDEAICGVLCSFSAVVNQLLSCPYSLTWYSIYYILVIFLLQFWHCICED